MATLQDIKRKIGAVKKTQQITKAMNMVSAAKLRGAQLRMEGFRPYAGAFAMMLGNMAGRVEPEIHPFFQAAAPVQRVGLVLMTADRGLCGSFNVNLINTAVKFIREKEAAGDRGFPHLRGPQRPGFLPAAQTGNAGPIRGCLE